MSAPSPDKKRMDLANQIDQSRSVKQLTAENSRLKAELSQLKKDLLNLLPIARHAMKTMTVAYAEGFNEEHLATFIGTLAFIDELTAKYTEGLGK